MLPSKINGAAGKAIEVVVAYLAAPVRVGALLVAFREHARNDDARFRAIDDRLDAHEAKESERHTDLVAGLSRLQGFNAGYEAARKKRSNG